MTKTNGKISCWIWL